MGLRERIERRDALIAVIGLGYVGLPLSVEKAGVGIDRVVRCAGLVLDTGNATAGIPGDHVTRLGGG